MIFYDSVITEGGLRFPFSFYERSLPSELLGTLPKGDSLVQNFWRLRLSPRAQVSFRDFLAKAMSGREFDLSGQTL